jgi:AsmA protein
MPLIFSKTLHITAITLDEPQITLLRGANGRWNFSSISGSSGAPAAPQATQADKSGGTSSTGLSVDKLSVRNGQLLVGTANSAEKPAVYDKVNLEVTNFSSTTQFPFSLTAAFPRGGDLNLKGKCGPVNVGAMGATPLETSLTIKRLDLAASGLVAPSSGIQGLVDFDGVINSNGQHAKVNGTLKVDQLKLVAKGTPSKPAVIVKYAVDYNLRADQGTLTQGDVGIGKAEARLTGTYQTQGQITTLNMKLNGSNMPVDELQAALPAVGVVLPSGSQLQGGTLSADLTIAGPSENPIITGPIRVSNAKLAGFDLGSKLNAIPALAGKSSGGRDTTIQNFSTTVRVAPESTQANDINLTIPSLGVVTGAGSVSPAGALNFKMNANVSSEVATSVIQKAGIGSKGGGVPFGIEGTTSDPKFVPDVKAMAGNAISNKVGEINLANPFKKKK